MEKHYQKILHDSEKAVLKSFQIQIMDQDSPRYGGFLDPTQLVQAKFAIFRLSTMTAVYLNTDSSYYHNEHLYERIMLGLNYVKGQQHENGLFDYVTCNFNSAPDTAFCINQILPNLRYLDKIQRDQKEEEIYRYLYDIIRSGAFGLLTGGFHTPNHRWAIASLLCSCANFFKEPKLSEAAWQYLNEGIDCNKDGEFSEKSAGNYNSVNNDAMILLSESLQDDSYDKNTVRNLYMMRTYLEPDGSIFTANSTRFDKDHLVYPQSYYIEYLAMGLKYNIPEFLDMANYIFKIIEEKQLVSPDILIMLMLYPEYRKAEHQNVYQPADYHCLYTDSGIVRARRSSFTYTVMKGKSNFLYFHNGCIKAELKIGGSFCEHRAFKAETLDKISDTEYRLHQTMHGWYYLPFEEKPETSDWWKMDQTKRKKRLGPDMSIDVTVKEVEKGIDVTIRTSGVTGAPWRIELALTGAEMIDNPYMSMPIRQGEAFVVKKGMVKAINRDGAILIGPAFGEHTFIDGKEDSELRNTGCTTVYFTDYTEFEHTISFRDENLID